MKLTVVGTGYVGIVTGTGFANRGNDVICFDIDREKIDRLSRGELTIYEPGLEEIYLRNLKGKRLKFLSDPVKAVQESDIIFICVGTPSNEVCAADLSQVESVAELIGKYMNSYKVVVNKSTVPVGSADFVAKKIKENQSRNIDFDVVSNPEFLREGAAVKDFENPDRIVIGTESKKAEEILASLYRSVARADKPIMITGVKSAEIIKYASNAMLATRISFVNQLAYLCEKTGANIKEVSRGIGLDSRVGSRFLQAGIGYGGSCFPKDVKALIATLKKYECDSDLFEAVDRINDNQKTLAVDKLSSLITIKNSKVAIWGISFKPKTDDIREAPSLTIISDLKKMGAVINAFDPISMENAKMQTEGVNFFESPYEAIKDCDALIVVTEWDEFRNLDMRAVKVLLKNPVVIDGRNIYDPEEMKALGFTYSGIGV